MPSLRPELRPPSRYAAPSATYFTLNTVRRSEAGTRAESTGTVLVLVVVVASSGWGAAARLAAVDAGGTCSGCGCIAEVDRGLSADWVSITSGVFGVAATVTGCVGRCDDSGFGAI